MKINSIYKRYLILSLVIISLVLLAIAAVTMIDYKLLNDSKVLIYSHESKLLINDIEDDLKFIENFSKIIGQKLADYGENDVNFIKDIFDQSFAVASMNKNAYLTLFDFVTPEGKVVVSTLEGVINNPPIVMAEQRSWMKLAPKDPWKLHISRPDHGILSTGQHYDYIIPIGMGVTDKQNKFLGIISTGISVEFLYSQINKSNYLANVSFVLLSSDLELISPTKGDKDFFKNRLNIDAFQVEYGALPEAIKYKESKYFFYRKINSWPFMILVGEDIKSLENEFNQRVIPRVIGLIFVICLMFLFFYIIRRQIVLPIVDLAKITKALAAGNFDINVPRYNSNEMDFLAEELVKVKEYTRELKNTKEELEATQKILQSSNHELEHKVKERTECLEEALKIKTDILNNVSHEVRTPIQGITVISEGLVENWYNLDEMKKYSYATQVAINAKSLFSLVGNILDMSKFANNKMILDFKEINFNLLVREMIKECKTLYIRDKNIDLSFEDSQDSLVITADKEKITQVIRNLFVNAIKFSPINSEIRAKVSLTSISFEQEVDHKLQYKTEAIHFSLQDHGIGIPQDELERIFEAFHQSIKTQNKVGGTGLGLAIAREIIFAHHGKIWAESDEDGSTLHFVIPTSQYVD